MGVRKANLRDAAQILNVYKSYVLNSAITFETEIPTLAEFKSRLLSNRKYGWYVFELGQKIVGYAYASKHRDREAYQWSCEISIYIDQAFHRKEIATKLYTKLLGDLKKKGLVNIYAGITLPNLKSTRFHEKMGFKFIGTYKKIGFKMNRWHDVGWWERTLNSHGPKPKVPKL